MFWWKVKLLDDKIIECEKVCAEDNPSDGTGIVFVRAECRSDAKTEARRVRNLSATRKRQLAHEARGNCRCGRPPAPGSKRCLTCNISDKKSEERCARRRNGSIEIAPSKSEAFEKREKESRLDVFRLVKAQKENSPKSFDRWLSHSIRLLEKETDVLS